MRRVLRYLFLPLLAVLMLSSDAQSQGLGDGSKYKNFPVPFGPNNAGRDFWFAMPANWDIPSSAQYYIRLYITSGVRTSVRVWTGAGIKKVFYTKPYDIITVDLSPIEAQVFTRNDVAPVPNDQVYRKKAVHVEADAPVVVYAMNRTSFTSDGILVLPVNALGREYIVASYAAVIGVTQELPSQFMIVAPYNNTTVSITQPMRTPNHSAGEKVTFTMDSGDVYSAMTLGYGGDMSGAYITASKPVAVTAGQNCTYIPNLINYCCCDHLSEMMLPLESWGKYYQGVPFQTRKKGDFWRIFAGADNTTVYINGQKTATLSQKGGEEGIGWFEYKADGKGLQEFTADKPIYISQYNTSQAYDGVPSDPFYLVLTPVEQYQSRLTFCTPSDDFPQNYVNLMADSATFRQIEIAPGGTDKWDYLWKSGGTGVPKPFPTKINGRRYVGVIIDLKPGVYQMRGPMPFAGYIYGFSAYDSYGYPLSVAVGDLTRPDVNAPEIIAKQACDGSVDGQTVDLPDDSKIRTNLATIELDPDTTSTYNYALSYIPFEVGVSIATNFSLRVIDKSKPAQAIIVISDMAGNVNVDTFTYRPFLVSIDPKFVDFGPMNLGDTKRMPLTITNLSTEPADVKEALLRFGDQGFKLIKPIGPFTLGPAGSPTASVDAEVEFTATAENTTGKPFMDSLGLRDACGLRYIALLEAVVGTPKLSVTDHDFGTVIVGSSAADWSMTVKNSGTAGSILTVTGYSGPTDKVAFTLPNGMPAPFPWKLKAGETKQFVVRFTAGAVQPYLDTLVFTREGSSPDDDPNGIISGAGVKSSLIATSFSWPRVRVGRSGVPDKVYLKNLGTSAVRVTNVTFSGNTGDFTLNAAQVRGVTLNPGDSIPVDVTFTPTAVGNRAMRAVYETDPVQESEVYSTLDGIGVMPYLATRDYDYGQMDVGDPEVNRSVEFYIPTGPGFEWADAITITGFQFRTDQGPTGTADYRRVPADQPIQLVPGGTDRVTFTGYFQAQAPGLRTAELKALTLDGVDTTSHWTGRGVSKTAAITGQGDSLLGLCIGNEGVISAFIENSGAVPLRITGLSMSGGDFQILSPDPSTPFDMAPLDRVEVRIRYRPVTPGVQREQLIVANSTGITLNLPITGSSRSDVLNTALKLNPTKDANVELGKDMVSDLKLDVLPAGAAITSARVTFTYDPVQLVPRTNDLRLGSICPAGATAVANTALSTPGSLVVDMTFPSPVITGGTLISVPFGVIFTQETTRSLAVTVEVPANNCLTVNGSNSQIPVEPICGLSLRLIRLTNATYTLDQNKPNPFNPVTRINYSLGLDGRTQIYLYDANGKLVQKLVDEYQKPGMYELTLDVSNLPSGNYYYKLLNGTWSKTRMLTVVK